MEILLIVVVGVIISIISAAGKKKPNRASDDTADTVPVRPTLSDIQKAFMMSGDMEAPPRRETAQAARQVTAKPIAPKQPEKATERLSARTFETPPAAKAGMPRNKYANIDPGSFHAVSADINDDTPLKVNNNQKRGALRLFEDKDDFVRAVIYSEILTRKAR